MAERYHLRSHYERTPLVVMVRVQPRSFTTVVGPAFICTTILSRRAAPN